MDIPKNINQMAKSAGFDYAKSIGEWKGHIVYRLMLNDRNLKTGMPMLVLEDQRGECRFSDYDETIDIFNAVYA